MTSRNLALLLRAAAAIHGPAITPSRFLDNHADLEPQILANLVAAWTQLRRDAGLPERPPRSGRKRFTDGDLLVEYDRVRTALGKDPTWAEINRHAAFSRQTYQDRIGTIRELRDMHREWAELRDRAALGDPDAGAALAHRTRTLPPAHLFAGVLPDLAFLAPLPKPFDADPSPPHLDANVSPALPSAKDSPAPTIDDSQARPAPPAPPTPSRASRHRRRKRRRK